MNSDNLFYTSPQMFNCKVKENPGKYPPNIGKPWTDENIAKLLADVQKNKTHEEMAVIHGRTVGGISSRLKEISAEYYLNNEMSIKDIVKYTGLSIDIINDAISRRQYRDELAEKRKESKGIRIKPLTQTHIEDSFVFQTKPDISTKPEKNDYHDTLKELLVVAKDIQRMMKDFHADNFVQQNIP